MSSQEQDSAEADAPFLTVDISDALSEKDKIKFTVHMKTNFPQFTHKDISVIREHEEFIWLYNALEENPAYAGYIIPPPPPRPDFDTSRDKLHKLSEGESTMTQEEFAKMKADLEAEYLATFKKTVSVHEVFLSRIAAHPILKDDSNFRIFLEYEDSAGLSIRGKNKKEKLESIWKRFSQSADELLLSGQKDPDSCLEHEKNYLIEYHINLREAVNKADRMTKTLKNMSEVYINMASLLDTLGSTEKNSELSNNFLKVSETCEKVRKVESRVASDYDLKLADTFRYTARDTQAAKDLLYRRLRCLANVESTGRNLERARLKNRDILRAEADSQNAQKELEEISVTAKKELNDFKTRRVAMLKKNLIDMAELQLKHAKTQVHIIKSTLVALKQVAT